MQDHPTFEETYPKYAFAELVRIGVTVSAWILRVVHRGKAQRSEHVRTLASNREALAE
jgi:hypothetical protein